MTVCIWCKMPTHDEPEEHILPHGLVGEARFTASGRGTEEICLVLKDDEVCEDCNVKRLNPLDAYLQKQLGFFKIFLNRTGTKRGRPAKIEKPGIFGIHCPDGPHIHLSGERKPIIVEDGIVVQPAKNHPDSVRLTEVKTIGSMAEAKFNFGMRITSKWFFRALHKIAFEMLCFQQGVNFVLDSRFDAIRDYVLRGQGSREMFMTSQLFAGQWEKPGVAMHLMRGTSDWLVELRIGPWFFIDLSPENSFPGGTADQLLALGLVRLCDRAGVIKAVEASTV